MTATTITNPQIGDYVSETLVTDTVLYRIVATTARTIKIVRALDTGRTVARENRGGNPYPVVWTEVSAPLDPAGAKTLRLRKDGTYRTGPGGRPLRPATQIDGVPVQYTDYRM